MNETKIKELIQGIREGRLTDRDALEALKRLPFADLGHTKVDHHRALRQGAGEVIFAEGKRTSEIVGIVRELRKGGSEVLVTRASPSQARAIRKSFPGARYNAQGRTVRVPPAGKSAARPGRKSRSSGDQVAIVSAGTADAPVVEEAQETLAWLGLGSEVVADAGVAGIHRLLAYQEVLDRARVIIVVAGMEGALASVVGGLVSRPVIAVPVSVGYGAGAGGVAALLGMLNSCAAGVVVTNIDNGFGAACAAARILNARERD